MKRRQRTMEERGLLGTLKCWTMKIVGVSASAVIEGQPIRASRWTVVSWRSVGAEDLRRPWYSLREFPGLAGVYLKI